MGNNIYKTTNREQIIKCIKLELVPTEHTEKAIKEHGAMEADRKNIESAEMLHEVVDYVVKKIIRESLENCGADFEKLYTLKLKKIQGLEKGNAYNNELDKVQKIVTKILTNYKLNGMNIGAIGEAKSLKTIIPEILVSSEDISTEKKTEWIDLLLNTNGLSTLLKKFVTSRITAVSTSAPKRVMENFEIFTDNIEIVKDFLNSGYAEGLLEDYPEFASLQYAGYYEFCLTPEGINGYNQIISGTCDENGIITKGYNQIVNELNTAHKSDEEYDGKYFKKMKALHQQILMPKEKMFSIEKLKTDDEVRELIKETMQQIDKKALFEIVSFVKKAKVNGITIGGKQLHVLSHLVYGKHNVIPDKIIEAYIEEQNKILAETAKKSEQKKIKSNISRASVTVANNVYTMQDIIEVVRNDKIFTAYTDALSDRYHSVSKSMSCITASSDILTDGKLQGNQKNKKLVKNYFDSLVEFRKCLSLISKTTDDNSDVMFYNEMEEKCDCLKNITRAVNLVRSYLTSKAGDFAKEYQICFGVPSKYTSRWWHGEEGDKFGANTETILNMDGKYYYVTTGYKQRPFMFQYAENGEDYYEIFNQKTGQDAAKHFPAVVFSKSVKDFFEQNPEGEECLHDELPLVIKRSAYDIYKNKLFSVEGVKSGERTKEEQMKYLGEIIDLYKEFAKVYPHYQRFVFDFKDTSEYKDLGEFMADANVCMVDSTWEKISKKQMDMLIETGNVYAFLITNRNMYKENSSKTTYAEIFLQMMSKENFSSGQIRINARPAISFRKACVPYHVTHPKGSMLVNKKLKDGSYVRGDLYKEIYNYYNENGDYEDLSDEARYLIESGQISAHVADYDIIKNKRYMEDKYFISISYIQNARVSARAVNRINEEVAEDMKNGYRTLSVTRGTTNLIYYTLYDKDRSVMEEGSLNKIGDMDFGNKLKQLSRERKLGPSENWEYDLTVKNIKTAYLDFAIGEIIRIAIENEAVIVIEKLNEAFKDRMSFIDNQIYKGFEKRLESRLLDYKRKGIKYGDAGSLSNPVQLARTYQGASAQNGILFKINAAYTRNMCPYTGFVNLFDFSNVKTISAKRKFLAQFDSIIYNEKNGLFEFEFDYKNFDAGKNIEKTKWTVYAGKPITVYDKEKGYYDYIEKPAQEVHDLLFSENLLDKNLAEEELNSKITDELFNVFKNTLMMNVVKACDKVSMEHYSSPVMEKDEGINPDAVKSYNLAKKLWYHVEQQDSDTDMKNSNSYTENWLNYSSNEIILKPQ